MSSDQIVITQFTNKITTPCSLVLELLFPKGGLLGQLSINPWPFGLSVPLSSLILQGFLPHALPADTCFFA